MERYGANTISTIEDLFAIDSEHIIRLLQSLDNENPEPQRWELALAIVDSFLSLFKLDLLQRKDFSNMNAESFKKQFGFVHHHATKPLNDKYRIHRKNIENAMMWKNKTSETMGVIKSRMSEMTPLAEKLILMEKTGELKVMMNSLLASLIHMSLDRWFRTKNKLYEMVICDFLSRYYKSKIAKDKYNS